MRPLSRSARSGFTLLEVMVALSILVLGLASLLETQSTAVLMTYEAERMVVASELAREKLQEVALLVEEEGFTDQDRSESGDFSDFGDEVLDVSLGDALEDYHYEWEVVEVDMELPSDMSALAGMGGVGAESDDAGPDVDNTSPDLTDAGISPDMITDMLSQYLREVKVRVWWGSNSRLAEERGDEIILVTHVSNPSGQIVPASGEVEGN